MLNFDLRAFVITDTNYILCTFTHNCYLLMVIHAPVNGKKGNTRNCKVNFPSVLIKTTTLKNISDVPFEKLDILID